MGDGGEYGSDEYWERIEAPIKLFDPELERFAAQHSLPVTRNDKEWPGRSMTWGEGVRCLIQLYIDYPESLTVNLWICASQDRGHKRYWKQEMLCKGASAEGIAPRLPDYLKTAKDKLDYWSAHTNQLEFATELAEL